MGAINSTVRITDGMSKPLMSMNRALNMVLNSFEDLQNVSGTAINVSAIEEARNELNSAASEISAIEENMNKAGQSIKDTTQKADGLASTLGKVAGVIAGLGIGRMMASVFREGLDYASDLTEVQNVVDVTFGQNSSINEWAKTTLDAIGLNELSAKRYASTMGAMLKSSGLTGDAVETMSKNITRLTGDMASFYNLESEEAFSKIRSGISGETEPLKQLGINMSVANLEAYALSQGIEKSYDKMSQAEQVLLRYNYLLSAAADSQGDFARTSDSYANQVKLLRERWLELTGSIAEKVLPALTSVLEWLNNILSKIDEYAPVLEGVAIAVGAVAGAVLGWHTAQLLLNSALLECPIFWIIAAVGILIGAIYSIQSAGASVYGFLLWVLDGVGTAFESVISFVAHLIQDLINLVVDLINSLIDLSSVMFESGIMTVLNPAAQAVYDRGLADMSKRVPKASFADSLDDTFSEWQKDRDDDIMAANYALDEAKAKTEEFNAGTYESIISDLSSDVSDISESASGIEKALDVTEEDLKFLRDMAEQEAINRFTTAEIKIEMGGINNTVNERSDLDGIVDYLEGKLYESMSIAAEGVY